MIQSNPIATAAKSNGRLFRFGPWLLLGLLVFGAKLTLIDQFAWDGPFEDEWDAIADGLYRPAVEGTLSVRDFIKPHNEHRIVPTKLLYYLSYKLSGNVWDVRLLQVFSVSIHAAMFCFLGCWLQGVIARRARRLLWGGLAVLGTLPFAYANTLFSFQSQFYFMFLFTALAGWSVAAAGPNTWTGLIFPLTACLAVISMGSGGLVGAAVILAVGLQAWSEGRWSSRAGWAVFIGTCCVLGMLLLRTPVDKHSVLMAKNVGTFCLAFLRTSAWPLSNLWWIGPILWSPWLILAIGLFTRRVKRSSGFSVAIFLGGWVLLQIAALAWARGRWLGMDAPASRYQDVLLLGLLANFVALLEMEWRSVGNMKWLRFVTLCWSVILVSGVFSLVARIAINELMPARRQFPSQQVIRISWFLRTDREELILNTGVTETGYTGDAHRLLGLLRTPSIRQLMSASFGITPRSDLKFIPEQGLSSAGYAPGFGPKVAYPAWGSWSPDNNRTRSQQWTSQLFELKQRHLQIDVVAMEGEGTVQVGFIDEAGVTCGQIMVPNSTSGWRTVNEVLRPGMYRLRIQDKRSQGWFAFSEPREIPLLAWSVRVLIGQGVAMVVGAGLLALCWLAWPWLMAPRHQAPDEIATDAA